METTKRETIRRRIKSRMKGLVSLILAVTMITGVLPVTAAGEDNEDNYYLIVFDNNSDHDKLLCHGAKSIPSNDVFRFTTHYYGGDFYGRNSYVECESGSFHLVSGSPLSPVGTLSGGDTSNTVDLIIPTTTDFYFGSIQSGLIEVKLDGTSKGYTTSSGMSKNFKIFAGKYTIQHTNTMEPASQNPRMTFDIKTSSIALSASTMVITYADTPKTLTVTPANANVNWTSSNPSVVKVEGGKVTPVNVGSADITATLVSNPNVKATCKITVRAMPITRATVTLDREQLDYDGLEQAVHVTGVVVNGITLTSDDYEVSGDRGTDPGPYTVTVTGKGNYSGTAQASWSIVDNTAPEQPNTEQPVTEPETEGTTEQPVMSETEPAPADVTTEKKTPASIQLSSQFKVTNSGSVVTVKYGKVTGADSYVVCAAYCNTSKLKKLGEVNRTKYTFSKLNKKKLDLGKCIKVYVIALQKGKELARTKTAHIALRKNTKYTNVKRLYVAQSSIKLKVGKTKKISTRVILENTKKSELPLEEHHSTRFTYASNNKAVATVNSKGKIKAVGKGVCEIWVYALNGTAKKIRLTVT